MLLLYINRKPYIWFAERRLWSWVTLTLTWDFETLYLVGAELSEPLWDGKSLTYATCSSFHLITKVSHERLTPGSLWVHGRKKATGKLNKNAKNQKNVVQWSSLAPKATNDASIWNFGSTSCTQRLFYVHVRWPVWSIERLSTSTFDR